MPEIEKEIRISVRDKVACLEDKEQFLVCGNNDYTVIFDFDSDWDGINAKTAVFVYGNTAIHIPFDGNECDGVAIENAALCAIGVFAGNIKTTTGATINCRTSIRDLGGVPKEPTPEVYDKIMELLNKYIEQGGSGGNDGFSPTVQIVPIDNGNRIIITDINGEKYFDVFNGEKGEQGIQGQRGEKGEKGTDGYSPVRGVDYWTDSDILAIKDYINDEILWRKY